MKQALKPIRKRMRFLHAVRGLLLGLLAGAGACLALTAVSFFIPIEEAWRYLLVIAAACPVLGMILGALWPVSQLASARRADACGLKERSITALALGGDETPMAALQRADAQAALAALPVRESMPIRAPRPLWLTTVALALATAILLIVPNPQHDILRNRQLVRRDLRAQADQIEKAAEQMEEKDMTEEELAEMRRITNEMVKDLREADDQREAMEKLSERQKEMEDLQRDVQQRRMENLAAVLGSQSDLSALSKAMESGSEEEVWDALEDLAMEMAESLDKQMNTALQLAEAAMSLPEGSTKQALAASAASAELGDLISSLTSLEAALTSVMSTSAQGSSANINLPLLLSMARSGAAQAGSGNGQGAGGGSGQGMGAGGGAGRGSTNQDMGYTPSMSQSKQGEGTAAKEDRVGTYERIYDPTRLGGDGEISNVQGTFGEGESSQIKLASGMGDLNGYVPYNQVIGEYQEAASQAMRRNALPASLQDWVDRYFNALID